MAWRKLIVQLVLSSATLIALAKPQAALAAPTTAAPATTLPSVSATSSAPNIVHCELRKSGNGYSGTCMVPCLVNNLSIDIAGPKPGAVCHTPPRSVNATLHKTSQPGHWLGTMQGKFPEDPTRFDVIEPTGNSRGVAKMPFGWFYLVSEKMPGHGMTLVIDGNKQVPPSQDDIVIIQKALSMLSSDAAWNRHDTRKCDPKAQKQSLFCALKIATIETTGGLQYRQPALQAVRQEVAKVFGSQVKKHRLMEYNNNPNTTLADVHQVLLAAETDIRRDQLQ